MRLPALLLTVGLAAGCSAQAEPPSLPVPTAASPSASPSPSGVALPSPKETGVAGEIERAVLGYFAALNEATRTSSTTSYRKTFTTDCAACTSFADGLDAVFAKGQRIVGAQDEIVALRIVPGSQGRGAADVSIRVPEYTVVDGTGKEVGRYPASSNDLNVFLTRQPDGRWLVTSSLDAKAG